MIGEVLDDFRDQLRLCDRCGATVDRGDLYVIVTESWARCNLLLCRPCWWQLRWSRHHGHRGSEEVPPRPLPPAW